MKINKLFIILLLILLLVFILTACNRTEVSRVVVDKRFTAAHDEVITTYSNILVGTKVILVPHTSTVHYEDLYELEYEITYDDGSIEHEWTQVTADEYNSIEINR